MNLRQAGGNVTQEPLARLVGTDQPESGRFETGEKLMNAKSAERLAEHVRASAVELVVENRVAAMKGLWLGRRRGRAQSGQERRPALRG